MLPFSHHEEKHVNDEMIITPALQDVIDRITDIAGLLFQRGWAEKNAGNISVNVSAVAPGIVETDSARHTRLPEGHAPLAGATFIVTGTETRMRDVARNWRDTLCIIRIDDAGTGYNTLHPADGSLRPTSEMISHLGIHQNYLLAGEDDRAIVHTHPTELVAMTHLPNMSDEARFNKILWAMHTEAMMALPDGVGLAGFNVPGSNAQAAATVAATINHRVCVWDKHGCLAVGQDVDDAFDLIETVNKLATIYMAVRKSGKAPAGLTDAQVRAIHDFWHGNKQ
jgi:rhamnulose-1-phosphate aldolase